MVVQGKLVLTGFFGQAVHHAGWPIELEGHNGSLMR